MGALIAFGALIALVASRPLFLGGVVSASPNIIFSYPLLNVSLVSIYPLLYVSLVRRYSLLDVSLVSSYPHLNVSSVSSYPLLNVSLVSSYPLLNVSLVSNSRTFLPALSWPVLPSAMTLFQELSLKHPP